MTGSPPNHGQPPKRISCRECAEFLGEYIEGALPNTQRIELERQLRKCPACVLFIEQYKRTVELTKKCTCQGSTPKSPCPEALVQAILAARSKPAAGPQTPDSPNSNLG